jgi:hypothetical protein
MASLRWWHLALLWIAAVVIAGVTIFRVGGGFRARATTGGGGLVGVQTPFWLRVLLGVLLLGLLVATVMWFRARSSGAV